MFPRPVGPRPNSAAFPAWAAALLLVLIGSINPGRAARADETSLRLASDPDDPVGMGIEFFITNGLADFTIGRSGEMVRVVVDPAGPGDVWTLEFEAAGGAPLQPGRYPGAAGMPASSMSPALHIGTDTQSCAGVSGSFDVRQLDLDGSGNVLAFRALFEQHCDGQTPALRGEICVNAHVPVRIDAPFVSRVHRGDEAFVFAFMMAESWNLGSLTASGQPAAATFMDNGDNTATLSWFTTIDDVGRYPVALTGMVGSRVETVPVVVEVQGDHRLVLDSEPGEPLAGGNDLDLSAASGWFRATEAAASVEVEFADWNGDAWSVRMAGPAGSPLAEGFAGPTGGAGAVLDVRHNGLAAPAGSGFLVVHELRHDAGGYLESIRAAFEQHPVGSGPTLRGEVWFNSRAVLSVRAPGKIDLLAGQPVTFDVRADDVRGGPLTLNVAGLPAGGSFVDHANGTGTLTWNTPAGVASQASLEFTVTAADGRLDRATTSITVTRPNMAPLAEAGGPYAGTTGVALVLDGTGSSDPDNDPLTHHWNFGDGQVGGGGAPVHAWSAPGTYLVHLTVGDGAASATDSAIVTIVDPVDETVKARAFLTGPNRDLKLFTNRPWFTVQLERTDRNFRLGEVDQHSLVMFSTGTGSIDRVTANVRRTVFEADSDGNGRRELAVAFDMDQLKQLFDGVNRPSAIPVRIEGRLDDGRRLVAEVTLTVTPKPGLPIKARSVGATVGLIVEQSAAGRLAIRLFDTAGRLVRDIVDADRPAGVHEFSLDNPAARLPAGLYFYRVAVDGQVTGGKLMIGP